MTVAEFASCVACHTSSSTKPTECSTKGSRTISEISSPKPPMALLDKPSCVCGFQTLTCTSPDVVLSFIVSATWPESVRKLASTFLRSPFRITVGSDDLTANSRVSQCKDHVIFVIFLFFLTFHVYRFAAVEVFEDPRTKR